MSSTLLVSPSLYGKHFIPFYPKRKVKGEYSNELDFERTLKLLCRQYNNTSSTWEVNLNDKWVDRWGTSDRARVSSANDFLDDFTELLSCVVHLQDFHSIKTQVGGKAVVNWDRVCTQALVKFDKVVSNVVSPLNYYDVTHLRTLFNEFVKNLRDYMCVMDNEKGYLELYYAHGKYATVLRNAKMLTSYMQSLLQQRFEITHQQKSFVKRNNRARLPRGTKRSYNSNETTTEEDDVEEPSVKKARV